MIYMKVLVILFQLNFVLCNRALIWIFMSRIDALQHDIGIHYIDISSFCFLNKFFTLHNFNNNKSVHKKPPISFNNWFIIVYLWKYIMVSQYFILIYIGFLFLNKFFTLHNFNNNKCVYKKPPISFNNWFIIVYLQ